MFAPHDTAKSFTAFLPLSCQDSVCVVGAVARWENSETRREKEKRERGAERGEIERQAKEYVKLKQLQLQRQLALGPTKPHFPNVQLDFQLEEKPSERIKILPHRSAAWRVTNFSPLPSSSPP